MKTTVRLTVISGYLCFPSGGFDAEYRSSKDIPSVLMYSYPAGDFDMIAWPITKSAHSFMLARALYDERECNSFFPYDVTIELPNGIPFDFDSVLAEGEDAGFYVP